MTLDAGMSERKDGTTFLGELPGPGPWKMTYCLNDGQEVPIFISPHHSPMKLINGSLVEVTEKMIAETRAEFMRKYGENV